MASRHAARAAQVQYAPARPPHCEGEPLPPGIAPNPAEEAPAEPFLTLALHGHGIELSVRVPSVQRVASAILAELVEPFLPGEPAIRGHVLPFEEAGVLRQLSSDAVRVDDADLLLELYRDPRSGERVWLVDERWGICEINLLRRSWRSWILPHASIDAVRLFEAAVMWPMAQLLRGGGLHLIPAAAVGRAGRGALILSPFDVGLEIEAFARAGVGVIGQRWVALREEPDGRISLLGVPGRTEQCPAPRLLSAGPMGQAAWIDLAAEHECPQAVCELVLLVEPMRRSAASARPLTQAEAREQLRQFWPVPQLSAGTSPMVATNLLAANLARTCPVHRVRLSRRGEDLVRFLVRPEAAAA